MYIIYNICWLLLKKLTYRISINTNNGGDRVYQKWPMEASVEHVVIAVQVRASHPRRCGCCTVVLYLLCVVGHHFSPHLIRTMWVLLTTCFLSMAIVVHRWL